jgi:hypothetical protein
MAARGKKSLIGIIISRVIGICIFLILLWVALVLRSYIGSPLYHSIVNFFWENVELLIFLAILFLVAELFGALDFPLNLPAPLFNGIASIFLIAFLFMVFLLVNRLYNLNISSQLHLIEILMYPLVFIIIVIVGYAKIFASLGSEAAGSGERPAPEEAPSQQGKSWEEIGSEFRGAIYDLLHKIREELRK